MNELTTFNNAEFGTIRTVVVDGGNWFVGKDVAQALGYVDTKSALADRVDQEDRQLLQRGQIATLDIPNRGMTIINESGLYALVLSSKLPRAKVFKRWVTSEVLPSIRKNGAYMTPDTLQAAILNPDYLLQIATKLKEETDKRKALEVQAEQDRPKVLFAEAVTAGKNTILVRDLAKFLKQNGVDTGQNRLFQWMRKNGYLCYSGDDITPTQKAMNMGLFEITERPYFTSHGTINRIHTRVTPKGQQYFINKFLNNPLYEAL